MRIGLVPMSAKPYHAGHDMLVRLAANECDSVKLFVSISDRERTGEISISGRAMEIIWKQYIEKTLPQKVSVEYGGSPVGKIYDVLAVANGQNESNTYVIYSDDVDIETNFPDAQLAKFEPLDIQKRGIDRSQTVQVSGTKMRAFLQQGDVENFSRSLPPAIQPYASEIINILRDESLLQTTKKAIRASTKIESLLRNYIRNVILF